MARRIVIVGAGISGCSLADELTGRGETGVTMIDRGPLFRTGGSTSHAPGLATRTSPSRMLHRLADRTIAKLCSLELDGEPCFLPVGSLEVATTGERLDYLRRRADLAAAWGFEARLIDPEECARVHPLIEPDAVLGGFHTAGEGIAKALRGAEAQARRAGSRGATLVGDTRVTGIRHRDGRVAGVETDDGFVAADVVVLCAGGWGRALARTAGVVLPMLPMQHQYVVTAPVPRLAPYRDGDASLPLIRHWDGGVYLRDEGDRVGIGSFNHRALPVGDEAFADHDRPQAEAAMLPFTPADFDPAWRATLDVAPALDGLALERAFNGVFPYSPDGLPLIGETAEVAGLWILECLWITHAVGAAGSLAEILCGEAPTVDVAPGDLARFDAAELTRADYELRCSTAYVDTYAIHHPAEPSTGPRGVRRSPFWRDQEALGAAFFDTAGWERARWYEANAGRVDPARLPRRDAWSSRHWSPIAIAEHRATRDGAGIFDLSPLRRIRVEGPDGAAFLSSVAGRPLDRPVRSVTYTVLLDESGGIASDVTVTRLAENRFLVGGNSPRDAVWLRSHAGRFRVRVDDVTAGTCCAAVWGPAARDLLAPLTDADLANEAFPYLTAQEIEVGGVRVVAIRVSYAGELGWELSTSADCGPRLWESVWRAGERAGAVAAGRGALGSLRLEKGYRAWGQDISREDTPEEAGLAFAVRRDGREHVAGETLRRPREPRRRLRTLRLAEPDVVPTHGGPVVTGSGGRGYVTSAEYCGSVEATLALAWLPPESAVGDEARVSCAGVDVDAVVVADVQFDPAGDRLRS